MSLDLQQIFDNPLLASNNGFQAVPSDSFSLNFNPLFSTDSSPTTSNISTLYLSNSIIPATLRGGQQEVHPENPLLSTSASDLLSQLYGAPLNFPTSKSENKIMGNDHLQNTNDSEISNSSDDQNSMNSYSSSPSPSFSSRCNGVDDSYKSNSNQNTISSSSSISPICTTGNGSKSKRKRALKGSISTKGVSKRGRRISSNSTLPCPVCQQAYSRKDNLRAHMRVHSGEKPYKCNTCPESFRWLGALRKHNALCTGSNKTNNEKTNTSSLINTYQHKSKQQSVLNETSNAPIKELNVTNNLNQNQQHMQQEQPSHEVSNMNCLPAWSSEKSTDQFLSDDSFVESWTLPELNSNLLTIASST